MISLKSAPKKVDDDKSAASTLAPYDEPAYPYGTCLHLNTETLAKLGIKEMPKVGTTVRIVAEAVVASVSQNQERDGDERRELGLQITDMEPPAPSKRGGMYDKSDMAP